MKTKETIGANCRKETPIYSGVLNYFPLAIAAVAQASFAGQQQHNPDKPLCWDRSKSGDELDALSRHLLQAGEIDTDGVRHSAKVAWRALANLQKELEGEQRLSELIELKAAVSIIDIAMLDSMDYGDEIELTANYVLYHYCEDDIIVLNEVNEWTEIFQILNDGEDMSFEVLDAELAMDILK